MEKDLELVIRVLKGVWAARAAGTSYPVNPATCEMCAYTKRLQIKTGDRETHCSCCPVVTYLGTSCSEIKLKGGSGTYNLLQSWLFAHRDGDFPQRRKLTLYICGLLQILEQRIKESTRTENSCSFSSPRR